MSPKVNPATGAACVSIVYEFFHSLDNRCHEKAALLFSTDGVWVRNGEVLNGRDEISAALSGRSAERRTFHAVSNPIVDPVDVNRVQVRFFLTVYEAEKGVANATAAIQPTAVRFCMDTLTFDGEQWLILRKSSQRHLPFVDD